MDSEPAHTGRRPPRASRCPLESRATEEEEEDNKPVVGLVEQLDDGGDAIVCPHGILCHFSLLVA
ncbi:hypothetical protein INR49_026505 [Caranx melampygus]|nr:hypothetical protein INR49_026505 [Caranx melampygus]